jgi:hypothetical protein
LVSISFMQRSLIFLCETCREKKKRLGAGPTGGHDGSRVDHLCLCHAGNCYSYFSMSRCPCYNCHTYSLKTVPSSFIVSHVPISSSSGADKDAKSQTYINSDIAQLRPAHRMVKVIFAKVVLRQVGDVGELDMGNVRRT